MDDNDTDIQLLLVLVQELEAFEQQEMEGNTLAAAGLVIYVEEACRIPAEWRSESRLYLTRPQLLPNPRESTPWQILRAQENNCGYITTTGVNVAVFQLILDSGFEEIWNNTPILRGDVSSSSTPRAYRRSLEAAGALGLVLHWLNSTMMETSLVQIFAVIPTTVSRYIEFSIWVGYV